MSQSSTSSTNLVGRLIQRVDTFQRRHSAVGFLYAVMKKYGDDQASYQAALISYYGFLSLFPLLMVIASVTQLVARHNQALQAKISTTISTRFPAIGPQLIGSIHASSKTGIALIVGLLLTIYGAKGVADTFQNVLNHIWQIPKASRTGFPKAPLKSLAMLGVGGVGLLASTLLSGFASASGHGWLFKLLAFIVGYVVTAFTLMIVIKLGLSTRTGLWKVWLTGVAGGLGLQLLQVFGGYLVQHQLKNASSLYGTFAIVLGLLFWIYLQTEVLLYAIEANTVRNLQLWPRAIDTNNLTNQDKQAYSLYAKKERYQQSEYVRVRFTDDKR